MRRLMHTTAAIGLAGLATFAAAHASPLAEPVPPIGAAYDTDAAMAQHADPVASYTLSAVLDPAKHTVTSEGKIRWKNASRVPQSEIWVHLYLNAFKNERTYFMRFPATNFRGAGTLGDWGWVKVERFSAGGEDLWAHADKTSPGDPEDETDIRVPLPHPVPPGEELTIDVAFTSHLPDLLFRTGHFGGFHFVAQWFPKIARLEPDGRWAHFPFHRLSEFYADFGDYDVTVDTPASMLVGATGKLEGEVREGGRVKRRFVQQDVHDFAFTAWDQFHELTARTDDGVAMRVLFPPGYDAVARAELEAARNGLVHLGKLLGRYPYGTLTIVHPPAGADEAGGMEYPTLITTGGPWFGDRGGARYLEVVTVHELGHQWLYGLVATDEHGWPFLDEGLNSWAEIDVMEAWHPGSSAFEGLGLAVGLSAINRYGAIDAASHAPIAQPASSFATGGDYGSLIYARTAVVLGTLGNVYGEDALRHAIGRYARRYRFAHPGPEDLLVAVREVMGDDAAAQLRAALFDRATVDYTVAEVTSAADEPARGVFGDPETPGKAAPAEGGYRGSVLVRRRGALRFPVDVDLVGEDGTTQRVRWDAVEPSARIPYHGKSRLVRAVIDPEHKVLLDDDLSNNARAVRGARSLSGAVLDRIGFGAAAFLGGVLP